MTSETFGQTFGKMPDGTPVELFTLSDSALEARIINYGGIIVSLKVPDRRGNADDVVLGFDKLEDYLRRQQWAGSWVLRRRDRALR